MSRHQVTVQNRTYSFSPDDRPRVGSRWWALVLGRVIDELTGQPPQGEVTVQSDLRNAVPRVASDGLVGLVGIPQQVFPALSIQNYTIILQIEAPGYIPYQAPFTIAQQPNFPGEFTPPSPADLLLHREPTVIKGRTVQANGDKTTPLNGTIVTVTGIWRTPPPANIVVPPDPPEVISLRPGLYAPRTVAAGVLTHTDLPTVVGDSRFLLDDVNEGANPIRLSNRLNLATGDVLLIDADEPDLTEFIAIKTIVGASTAIQPATITLEYPLANDHRRNAIVQKVTPQPPGGQKQFIQETISGDRCVFLNNITGLTTGNQVKIAGGVDPATGVAYPDEYHQLSVFTATSDADGYYRLPPMSRVAQLEARADHGALTPIQVEFRPDYSLYENRLDFVFR